jgi:hypothetical protein
MSARLMTPDFMIIGAAKCGTTSLHGYLLRHRDIFMPSLKEPEFFSRREVFEKGLAWYQDLFTKPTTMTVCGEGSTTYTRWPHTLDSPALIAQHTHVKKFIYVVRNPIDRAYSHYAHHMRQGVTKTFEEGLASDSIYFDCGDYMMQIERYLRFFSADSILVVLNDELKRDPAGCLQRVQQFLGLEPLPLCSMGEIHRNVGDDDHYLRYQTTGRLRKLPGVSRVVSRLPKSFRTVAFKLFKSTPFATKISQRHQLTPMLAGTRKQLADRYQPSIDRLSSFIDRDLSHWYAV